MRFYSIDCKNENIDIYVARNLIPSKQNLDEDEFINVEAYSVDELCEMIYAGKIEDSTYLYYILGVALQNYFV